MRRKLDQPGFTMSSARRRTSVLKAAAPRILIAALAFGPLVFTEPARCGALDQNASTPAISRLQNKSPLARIEAVIQIRLSGDSNTKTADALVKCIMRDDDEYVREVASETLRTMAQQAKSNIPSMVRILKNPRAGDVRRARAAQVLGAIGNQTPDSMPALAEVAAQAHAALLLRETAAYALVQLGRLSPEAVPKISAIAFSPREDPTLRKIAVWALANAGRYAANEVPQLSSMLTNRGRDLALRFAAADALGKIAGDGQIATPVAPLAEVLRDRNEDIALREQAAHSMQDAQSMAVSAIPDLGKVLADRGAPLQLRLDVLDAILRIGQGKRVLSHELAEIVEDHTEDLAVRTKATQTLGAVGTDEGTTLELAKIVEDPRENLDLRRAAMSAIRPQDPGVKTAEAGLRRVLADNSQDPEVRREIAQVLAMLKPVSEDDVRTFLKILADPAESLEVREAVAYASGFFGWQGEEATPVLAHIVGDSKADPVLRRQACSGLSMIRRNGKGVVKALQGVLSDKTAGLELRRDAVSAIGGIGSDDPHAAAVAVPTLIEILKDTDNDTQIRQAAASYLGQMNPGGTEAISVLAKVAGNPQDDPQVRNSAVSALGNIGKSYGIGPAFEVLIGVLRNKNEQAQFRQSAANAIGMVESPPPAGANALEAVLRNRQNDSQLRASAARALGMIGQGSKTAASALAEALGDKSDDPGVRQVAAESLGKLGPAAGPCLYALFDALSENDIGIQQAAVAGFSSFAEAAASDGATGTLPEIRRAASRISEKSALARLKGPDGIQYVARIKQAQLVLETELAQRRKPTIEAIITKYRVITIPVGIWLSLVILCGAMLAARPFLLFQINEKLVGLSNLKPPAWILEYVFVVGCFHCRQRVLDAWVKQYIRKARERFEHARTVEERKVFVEMPMEFDHRSVSSLNPKDLRRSFDKERVCLMIWGEGGAGKTTIACQIAKSAMSDDKASRPCAHLLIPVIVEQDLTLPADKKRDPLVEEIRGRVRDLVDEAEAPSKKFVTHLLKRKRILVIVDGLSELSEDTRSKIQPRDPEFPANALVVTSRIEDDLGAPKTPIHPTRLRRDRLSQFMGALLEKRGKRELFNDVEFHEGCLALSKLVADRDITVLLARLYTDQMIASKETGQQMSAANVPDLMLEYLNNLNRKKRGRDDRAVQSEAKAVAWECLRTKFRPAPAKIDGVLAALEGDGDAKGGFDYLEQNLRLIRTEGAGRDRVKFELDPLAEYLAGIYLVEHFGSDEQQWRGFLSKAEGELGAAEATEGFLLAVRDCCLAKGEENGVPNWVLNELARLRGMVASGTQDDTST